MTHKPINYKDHRLLALRIKVKKHIKWTELGFILINRVGAVISFIQNVQRCQSLCKLLRVEILQWWNTWTATILKPVMRYHMKFYLCHEIYNNLTSDQTFTLSMAMMNITHVIKCMYRLGSFIRCQPPLLSHYFHFKKDFTHKTKTIP